MPATPIGSELDSYCERNWPFVNEILCSGEEGVFWQQAGNNSSTEFFETG